MTKRLRKTDALTPADYVAVVGIRDQAGLRLTPGDSCGAVNPDSLSWLLEQGAIAPAATSKAEA